MDADAPPTAMDADVPSTARSPSRWEALLPARARMADVLKPWPGAASMGLGHGAVLGQGSQGEVTVLRLARSEPPARLPAGWRGINDTTAHRSRAPGRG